MRRHAIYWSDTMKREEDPFDLAKAIIGGVAVGSAIWLAIFLAFLL
jgi:hypothetical protein